MYAGIAATLTTLLIAGDPSATGPSSPLAPAKSNPAAANAAPDETRDLVLLLDRAPMHFRVRIRIGGKAISQARTALAERWMKEFDADHDGRLSREEAQKCPALRKPIKGEQFLATLPGARAVYQPRDVEQTIVRMGGEPIVLRQDKTAATTDDDVFKFLDRDADGLIGPDEMAASIDRVAERDQDMDECVTFDEFLPPPPPTTGPVLAVAAMDQPQRPIIAPADLIRDASEPLLPKRMIKKYDRDRDAKLSAAELGWSAERFATLDGDKDGKLSESELRQFGRSEVDLELDIDLPETTANGASENAGGKLVANVRRGERLDDLARGNFAKVAFDDAVVSFSERDIDPVSQAMTAALAQFNALDTDGNGYLDKDETRESVRFETGLFDQLDVDGDKKIFADELKQYVSARSEPLANSCRIQIFDTGYGFFMSLDANGDGRISTREIRKAPGSLAKLDRDGKAGVSGNEPRRHFHVEFSRGVFQLASTNRMPGAPNQPAPTTPSFQARNPVGPLWFQRMDRNGDGDLSWNEFLGPRDVFHRLDADGDELVDPNEAAAAATLFK